ncbi:MAG: DHA2 family efflux MFS transporter permease subunit [Terracidiphilus sp.]|nr:DHA2 family efflux MFS transporter permease subunit [Terracidiphilus sp.]
MATAVLQSKQSENALWRPAVNPWLIAISVILPMFMEVLDTTIANVALNNIAGSMSASYSQATWVLTSYLISNAVVLPITAWLGNRFQRKRFLLFCIFLFTASSLMCGLSVNLPMLLVMRVIQGIGGGAMAPISQAILMESFPPRKQGTAQALFGLGVVVAPVVGPMLGGWLTDNYSWRWIFYINIPIGLVAMWAIQQTVEDPPWVSKSNPGPLDVFGLVALSLWLGCQEVALDKGQEDDWLGSNFIRTMIVLAIVGFAIFVVRELKAEKPMVDLRIFSIRNLSVGTALIFLSSVLIYGLGLLTPQFLQQLLGYTSLWAGIATAPLGLGAVVSMVIVGILVQKVDARAVAVFGLLLFAAAAFMLSRLTLVISPWTVFWPQVLAGSAMGFLFVTANVAATAPLRLDQIGTATGCMNLMRNVGGSVGIAVVSTFVARRSQVHQTMLCAHLDSGSPWLGQSLHSPMRLVLGHMAGPANSMGAALGLVYRALVQQAYLLAFGDVYRGLSALALLSIALVFALRKIHTAKNRPLH